MKTIQEVLKEAPVSPYTGSEATFQKVKEEIIKRYGEDEGSIYDPYSNCLSFQNWLARGFKVRKGEKAIRSVTFVEKKNEKGEVVERYPRTINLFYYLQIEPITK